MKTRTMIALALLVLLALPNALFAQETADPEAVIQGLMEAFNAGDVDASLAYYAEDAVVDIRPHKFAPDAPYEGQEGIRTWLEMNAAHHAQVEVTVESVEDGRITTTDRLSSDRFRQMGIDSLEGTDEILIEDGKIVSHTFTFSDKALVQMQAALATAEAQPGFGLASVEGHWALRVTIGPNVAAGVGVCDVDGDGNTSCSAVGSMPGENGERMRIVNEETGIFTIDADGMAAVVANRMNPDGSEATFHYDCVVTAAQPDDSGLRATEIACIQQEPADPSGALATSTLRRLPDVGGGMNAAAALNEITFTATDYAFDGPASVPAGWTRIHLVNEGEELHHAQILKLPEDKTMDDLMAAMQADPTHPPEWLSFAGGPSAIIPGDSTATTVDLEPGQYVVICLLPDAEGVPHAAHGMVHPLTVTASETEIADTALPNADITLTMFDFNFALSQELTPGTHTFHVVNEGPQPHEVAVVQLAPEATAEDFLVSMEPGAEGPPAGRPIGGMQVIDSGTDGYFSAQFEAGSDYLLICFHPDPETGAPHFALGMMQVISVRE